MRVAASGIVAGVIGCPGFTFAQSPILQNTAYSEPTTKSLSSEQKAELIKKLEKRKQHDKRARAGYTQSPPAQTGFDDKITEINRITAGLSKGDNYLMRDVNEALESPRVRAN
jgi:hypothetical protein